MKTDINGCSKCVIGDETYEEFFSGVGRRKKVLYQYDFRSKSGELFSCVKSSLEACRIARDEYFNIL